jgi:hypothetical protein
VIARQASRAPAPRRFARCRSALGAGALGVAALGACTSSEPAGPTDMYYAWDHRSVLCSDPIDDLEGVARNWTAEEGRFRDAHDHDWVTLVHAHQPGVTVSRAALEMVFGWADQYKLDYVQFRDLIPGHEPERGGLAFAFDDDDVAGWLSIRDILDEHHAKVTFFITRWFEMTDDQKAGIAELAADGHDIEPHTVHHYNAQDYVRAYGIDQYLDQEVLPSITALTDAGYPVTSFAYPFGAHDETIDHAVLDMVDIQRVRTTPGECPGSDTPQADGED